MCAASRLASPPTSRPPIALGWPVIENGPIPGRPIRPVSQMGVDDAIGLVGAAGRLVHTLREGGDDALGGAEPLVEAAQRCRIHPAHARHGRHVAGGVLGHEQRPRCAARMRADEFAIELPVLRQPRQQAVEQHHVAAGAQWQMQIGEVAGRGATRIDHDEAHAGPLFLGLHDALIQHRVTPGGIGADQHDQIGQLQILDSTPAPGPRRRRACARPRPRTCTAASWYRCWPSR